MITGVFHDGSGLGDQLFRYITVRTIAEDAGFQFGMFGNFKGGSFLNIPQHEIPISPLFSWYEKDVRDNSGNDIRSYDPEINFVEDNTIIDGSFEDDKYWGHNLANINKWLAVEPLNVPEEVCVVGFRGGEYYSDTKLGLPKEYFDEAIKEMRRINSTMRFQVHTDDPELAKQFFPDFDIVENTRLSHSKHTNMGFNWRSARYAKYAVVPNSAFFILPRLLKHHEDPTAVTISPRYWAGYNQKIWKRPGCFYKPFFYIHHESDSN